MKGFWKIWVTDFKGPVPSPANPKLGASLRETTSCEMNSELRDEPYFIRSRTVDDIHPAPPNIYWHKS